MKPLAADDERQVLRGISSLAVGVIGPVGDVRVSRFDVRLFLQCNQAGCHATKLVNRGTVDRQGECGDVGGL